MKVLSIGRGENCHIVYDNPQISRQHALLRIYPGGRIEIIDQSSNGTSVNGRPIKKGAACKVTRRDIVTFAGVEQLDWSVIPNPLRPYLWTAAAIVAIALVIAAIRLIPALRPAQNQNGGNEVTVQTDTTKREEPQKPSKDTLQKPNAIDSVLNKLRKEEEQKQKRKEAQRKAEEARKKEKKNKKKNEQQPAQQSDKEKESTGATDSQQTTPKEKADSLKTSPNLM